MTEPKLCKDCRWAVNHGAGLTMAGPYDWECRHPSSLLPLPPNLVTGEPHEPMYMACATARGRTVNSECCGPEGRWWEPLEVGFGP